MPLYDYECVNAHPFEARHGFDESATACPVCGSPDVHRVIRTAPAALQGMAASVGKVASKDALRAKWAEETPRLREKLVSKLGEDAVSRAAPTLNTKYD